MHAQYVASAEDLICESENNTNFSFSFENNADVYYYIFKFNYTIFVLKTHFNVYLIYQRHYLKYIILNIDDVCDVDKRHHRKKNVEVIDTI